MPTPAKVKAQVKWEAKAYDKILLRIRKDAEPTRETIAKFAESKGLSLNAFVLEAIAEKIQRG